MSLFNRKRQKDEADLIYEQAKKRAYAREVKKIAATKGWKKGEELAHQRFNQPEKSGVGFIDTMQKHRGFFENIANANWTGVEAPMPVLKKKPNG